MAGTYIRAALFVVLLATALGPAAAIYLPGVAPHEFDDLEPIPLKVNKMVSSTTQLPYEYYSLKFCQPEEGVKLVPENLGEILMGDRIENSPYLIEAGRPMECRVLCTQPMSLEDLQEFEERIREEYVVNWIMDNIPAAMKRMLKDANGKVSYVYQAGFPLGFVDGENAYLNNHVGMTVVYHTAPEFEGRRIVRLEVAPQSIKHGTYNHEDPESYPSTCLEPGLSQPVTGFSSDTKITFTYSVQWAYSPVKWSTRWDVYFEMTDNQIHWFSIVNSLMIVLFLSGMVAMIMMRTLRADFQRYHEMESQEEAQEETGWKLVHGDVFRPPVHPMAFSVMIGSGVQVVVMTVITLFFALLGFLSPAQRGGLMTAVVVLYVLMGVFAGYFSARMYKTLRGENWKRCTILTAVSFPGSIFLIFFVLNLFLAYEGSSGYVPFQILVGIVALWFGVSIPLVFFGSYLGFKKPAPENPVRTNQIPRQIPQQVWYMQALPSCMMGGILPFGAVFIELFFILSSIWMHQFYYMFGFLFIVFVILVVTCAEITIVMCYFQLCSEDYHWWWRSFLTSGSSALYVFLYSIFYFFTKLHITHFVSTLLYFGYMAMITIAFFVLTGVIGFYSCYFFVRKIYASVKVD
eukprot:TRINITY_DN12998_c0_g1_i1.p1 TRINITY_DN12998_c0_g1~~TRINITY_DN12998_c0_g1_i1.p1  ORF type:complete len:671 (+),score=249.85 TRINITY_DN12998_c0_g1_i1:123-2015(+)